jgi:hypothetical protein
MSMHTHAGLVSWWSSSKSARHDRGVRVLWCTRIEATCKAIATALRLSAEKRTRFFVVTVAHNDKNVRNETTRQRFCRTRAEGGRATPLMRA